jgi:hypothetical protein
MSTLVYNKNDLPILMKLKSCKKKGNPSNLKIRTSLDSQ